MGNKSKDGWGQAVVAITGHYSPCEIAQNSLVEANNLIRLAQQNYSNSQIDTDSVLRKALEKLLYCFWYNKEARVTISEKMHNIGFFLCKNFDCYYKYEGDNYYSDCPCRLLHCDFGFSLRAIEEYVCSICGKEILDCEHITGYAYNNIKCKPSSNGICNICLKDIGQCNHKIGNLYNSVVATKIVSNIEIITFDIVQDPEMVFTRVTKIPLPKNDVLNDLKKDHEFDKFKYGESPLYCLHCVQCAGYDPERIKTIFKKSSVNCT